MEGGSTHACSGSVPGTAFWRLRIVLQPTELTEELAVKTIVHETPIQQATRGWTCFIHPDVQMEKRGTCPSCGMKLIRTTAANAEPKNGHIGRIVAGTLVGGLVAAIVLTTLVFAGAREHVITGSALLAFAAAWGTLALFSQRWTNQPQSWAIVPSAVMGLAGAFILIVAPTGDELGWVWPPLIVALAIWLFVRSRRDLRSRTRVWVVYPVLASLLLSAVGGAYETNREKVDRTALPMAGQLISVGSHRLHLDCRGSGSPSVVLEAGLGEGSSMMSGWIAPDVAKTTRVCVYDRAGRGWSEAASGPQDGTHVAEDLRTLLQRAGEPGPYVLAGHSAGALYVLNFARLYPEQVAGVVLLDATSPFQYSRLASYPAFYGMFRRASALLPSLSRLGVGRLFYGSQYASLPFTARDEERAFWSTARHNRSLRDEFAELPTAMQQAQFLTSLGSRPLVVLTAGAGAEKGWMALQDDLARLSTNSVHRLLPAATHAMVTEEKGAAAQSGKAISDVVTSVRSGARVARDSNTL